MIDWHKRAQDFQQKSITGGLKEMAAVPKLATEDIQSDYRPILITPAIAETMLRKNTSNRPLSRSVVEQYAREMLANRWMFNGDAIRIAQNGTILDGQHRLHAVLLSEIPQRFIVVDSLHESTFHTIDRGKKRSAADSLAVSGEKHSVTLATALKWVYLIERQVFFSNSVSTTQLIEVLDRHPSARHWCGFYRSSKSLTNLFTSSIVSVATLGAEKYGDDVSEKFLHSLGSGENLKKSDPTFELREKVISSKSSTSKMPQNIVAAWQIKAFHAFANNKKINLLKYHSSEDFPKL